MMYLKVHELTKYLTVQCMGKTADHLKRSLMSLFRQSKQALHPYKIE